MAIEDLLKKAVAAFNALSPEQQAEMMEEQRQSWVRGNVGLSRDERGMTSPVMPRPAPADLKARDRKRYKLIRKSLQNKGLLPAATDTGLDYYTAADVMWSLEGIDPVPSKNGQWVKRSQAEELLVAERAKAAEKERLRFEGDLDKWMKIIGAGITGYQPEAYTLMDFACEELVKLRADNAAQAARIKELEERIETENLYQHEAIEENDARVDALEAKLAAAEKVREAAIELDEAISDDFNIFGAQQKLRAALGGKP